MTSSLLIYILRKEGVYPLYEGVADPRGMSILGQVTASCRLVPDHHSPELGCLGLMSGRTPTGQAV